jgi:signal transduction histidine kinase
MRDNDNSRKAGIGLRRRGMAGIPISVAPVQRSPASRKGAGPDDSRLIEGLRVVLAIIAGLLLTDIEGPLRASLTLGVIGFSAYALILLLAAANGSRKPQHRAFHWFDSCWFILLLTLAEDHSSRYYLFLYFPVFFAAWRVGYAEGIAIAAVSGLASLAALAFRTPEIGWTRLAVFPASLVIVGPLFAAMARVELAAQRSHAFALQLIEGLDPRRGFDALTREFIDQIARRFGASSAVFALHTFEGQPRVVCWEEEEGASELAGARAAPIAEKALSLPASVSLGWRHRSKHRSAAIATRRNARIDLTAPDLRTVAELADLMESEYLLSVPLACPSIGRLRLILAGESLSVSSQALDMLTRIVEELAPPVENAYLREQLAAEAAETERARIGRDLHDSAIQPYIGLKFAVEAVLRRTGGDNPVRDDIVRLTEMATGELGAMRDVISGLRGVPGKGGTLLSSAVRRQAARFGQLFGIEVEVEVESDIPISRRIAAELFHLVAEGLSNIRRHTPARKAWIGLSCADGTLLLRIRNENGAAEGIPPHFTPLSLTERAAGLGGSVDIAGEANSTVVNVRVPIAEAKS